MIPIKNVLLISEDKKLFSQIQVLSSNSYKLFSFPFVENNVSPDFTICDYHLIPPETFQQPSNDSWLILFDIFDEHQIIRVLKSNMKFIVRPFTAKIIHEILMASIRTTMQHLLPQTISFGDRVFHIGTLKIESPEGNIHLTPAEASILHQLLLNRGELCLRDHLLKKIQYSKNILNRNVDVHISSLRKKLGPYGKYITSTRGIGYTFAIRPPQKDS